MLLKFAACIFYALRDSIAIDTQKLKLAYRVKIELTSMTRNASIAMLT